MPRDTVSRAASALPAPVPIPPTVRGSAGDPSRIQPPTPKHWGGRRLNGATENNLPRAPDD